eukprot:6065803-Lingulodinium_polyedra.AAC.1
MVRTVMPQASSRAPARCSRGLQVPCHCGPCQWSPVFRYLPVPWHQAQAMVVVVRVEVAPPWLGSGCLL